MIFDERFLQALDEEEEGAVSETALNVTFTLRKVGIPLSSCV